MSRAIMATKTIRRAIGLLGLVLWVAPTHLWSQESSLAAKAHSGAVGPFAGLDDSLTTAADALLDSAVQPVPPANGTITRVGPPLENENGTGSWLKGRSGVAALRLNTLRPTVEPILRSHGVPDDLSAIILIESGGQAKALSPKGARGLWQLMPDTARRYGLRVDDTQDERLDPLRATDAAARYLRDLYGRFGDWKLALAAYNTGEGNVGNAIMKARTEDFDQLVRLGRLPLETSNYVPLVLAAIRSSGLRSLPLDSHEKVTSITVFASSNR